MSTFRKQTKHPVTGHWENALWADDYFGKHRYGVIFDDGYEADPEKILLETRDEEGLTEHRFTCPTCHLTIEKGEHRIQELGKPMRHLHCKPTPQFSAYAGKGIEGYKPAPMDWWEDDKYWANAGYFKEQVGLPNIPAIISEAERRERERTLKQVAEEMYELRKKADEWARIAFAHGYKTKGVNYPPKNSEKF